VSRVQKRPQLFALLRRDLGAALSRAGLEEAAPDRRTGSWMLQYERSAPGNSPLRAWFQRDVKSHHVDLLGSSFTLEFARSPRLRDRERFFRLLTAAEREEVRTLQNRVIERLPRSDGSFLGAVLASIFGPGWPDKRERITAPFPPDEDVWLRYRDEEDVVAWTGFLARVLEDLVRRFEKARPASE
jgi:hypothetical protein